ncbi:hypothetical protein B0H16DRAFT_1472018 [Mycena metata]|uniref:Uncharacterized protein n=1 Tax=Mycena metata TaxID=1033252 RepID=A0AAD7HQA6_9AGAR|nr:hypothetical protein B0H16DRAFT_1472018 [Mycena metata]
MIFDQDGFKQATIIARVQRTTQLCHTGFDYVATKPQNGNAERKEIIHTHSIQTNNVCYPSHQREKLRACMANPPLPFNSMEWIAYRLTPDQANLLSRSTLLVPETTTLDSSSTYIFVNPDRHGLDLDYIAYSRIIRVGDPSTYAGLEFRRTTCFQFLPQYPRSLEDFRFSSPLNILAPVNTFIIPPIERSEALSSVSFSPEPPHNGLPFAWTRRGSYRTALYTASVTLEEGVIDMRAHRTDIFCSVYYAEAGVYQVVHIYSCSGRPAVTENTLIFAPSAWAHGARVLANRGGHDNITRLICKLVRGETIELRIDSEFINIQDGWAVQREDAERL